MFPEYDFIVCTCIYNRTNTLKPYMESLLKNKNKNKFHIYLVVNFDELWPKHQALDDVRVALNSVDWQSVGLTHREAQDYYDILPTPNLGLSGYNLGLEIGKTFNNTPVLCCNDDTVFPPKFNKLLEYPITAILEGKEVTIDPNKIGAIGPCYNNKVIGCMKHQEYKENNNKFLQVDFIVGHCQLITSNALRKGFRYDSDLCTGFGPYDIAQSMIMLSLELNIFVNPNLCFTFPEDKESHFHCNKPQKWDHLKSGWDKMQKNLENFQLEQKKKYGFNKWYF